MCQGSCKKGNEVKESWEGWKQGMPKGGKGRLPCFPAERTNRMRKREKTLIGGRHCFPERCYSGMINTYRQIKIQFSVLQRNEW